MKVARQLLDLAPHRLAYWRGDHYRHVGTHWERIDPDEVKRWLYQQTESATYEVSDGKGGVKSRTWAPNRERVGNLQEALSVGLCLRTGDEDRGTNLTNGYMEGEDLKEHTPDRFNLSVLPYAYDASADCPTWEKFLTASLPDDMAAHAFLQEWFGYVLSGQTNVHKMACLIGVPRAGKGVTSRVLSALLGNQNVASPSLADLTTDYGKSTLIGKMMALISEPQWASPEAQRSVEPILRITGGDDIQINRKYAQPWNGIVGTRVMILANDTPRLMNHTGALASRMINVRFAQSFLGREDVGLEDRLKQELPGIFNWAREGYRRLVNNGNAFTVPDSHKAIEESVKEYSDPSGLFISERGTVHREAWCYREELHQAYMQWCKDIGRTKDTIDAVGLMNRFDGRQEGEVTIKIRRNSRHEERNKLIGFCPDEFAFTEPGNSNPRRWVPLAGQNPSLKEVAFK